MSTRPGGIFSNHSDGGSFAKDPPVAFGAGFLSRGPDFPPRGSDFPSRDSGFLARGSDLPARGSGPQAPPNGTIALRIERLGEIAAAVLRGDRLTVAGVFRRALYAGDRRGRLLCFLAADLEPGPLHVLCSGWPDDIRIRAADGDVIVRAGGLLVAPGVCFDPAGAALWRPEAWRPGDAVGVGRALAALRTALADARPGALFSAVVSGLPPEPGGDALFSALVAATNRGLAALAAYLEGREPSALEEALSLVGLGPGLTPSGDDILAGAFLALHALGDRDAVAALREGVSRLGPRATGRISLAHLMAAAEGRGTAVFHDCLAALLAGDGRDFPEMLVRIGKIGHTSGWDALLGILRIVTLRHGGVGEREH